MMEGNSKKIVSGVIWDSIGQYSTLLTQFIVLILISRIIPPEGYGVIGLLTVFTAIATIILDSGFSQALIQKKNVDQITYSSIFYINIFFGLSLYFILYILSPFIAEFYNIPMLSGYARILFLVIPIGSLGIIQNVNIQKSLQFKKIAIANIFACFTAGILGITMAYNGFGIWSLVYQQLTLIAIRTFLYFIQERWIPKLVFSINAVRQLFSFSMNLMLHSLINTFMTNLYTLVIGKYYSAIQVGYYNQAYKFETLSASTLTGVIMRVSFPILVNYTNDLGMFRERYVKILKTVLFLIVPLMVILIIIAEPLFKLLLTDKWLPAVPYFRLLCIYGMMLPTVQLSYNVFKLFRKGKTLVIIDSFRHALFVISIIVTIKWSVSYMLIGQNIVMILIVILNLYYSGKCFNYSLLDSLKSVFPFYVISCIIGSSVYFINLGFENNISYIIKTLFFIFTYYVVTWMFKINYVKELFKSVLNRKL